MLTAESSGFRFHVGGYVGGSVGTPCMVLLLMTIFHHSIGFRLWTARLSRYNMLLMESVEFIRRLCLDEFSLLSFILSIAKLFVFCTFPIDIDAPLPQKYLNLRKRSLVQSNLTFR